MRLVRPLVRHVLENAECFDWTTQGLGMLRTYLDEAQRYRLHIWHAPAKRPGVSELHSHPWDFTSFVISGAIGNTIYSQNGLGEVYNGAEIICGAGAKVVNALPPTILWERPIQIYGPGELYVMQSSQIHSTAFQDGTVTLVERRFKPDRDRALVFWPASDEWGSAEPRPATPDEIFDAVEAAFKIWPDA